MPRYAQKTEVPADRSRAEIERTLIRYGADPFAYGWEAEAAVVSFRMRGRLLRFLLPLPDPRAHAFTHTASQNKRRTPSAAEAAREQAVRQRWRALALAIKAKIETVEAGIGLFEEEFLAYIVLPNQQTVGQWMKPQIARVYETQAMPALLPGLTARELPPPAEES